MLHRTLAELEAGLAEIRGAPPDAGVLELIVRRPAVAERELLERAELDPVQGLVGDNWSSRGSSGTEDGSAHHEMQLTIVNSRVIALIAGERERWALAGDQLYIDMDLSVETLPPGTRMALGSAVIEVTAQPHTGCGKFVKRFGVDAMKLISSAAGKRMRLRGLNARVVQRGQTRIGDRATRLGEPRSASRLRG